MEEMGQEQDLAIWLPIPHELDGGRAFVPLSQRRAQSWALVLEARGIPCRLEPVGIGWRLLVPADSQPTALGELRLYEKENRNWPPPLPPATAESDTLLTTLSVLLLIAIFHNLTLLDLSLSGHVLVDWSALGNADAGKICDGQWWRTITALTLHADWPHLLGNLAIGGVFISRLSRDLGSGLAWTLLLTTGALGNLLNALLQAPDHRAVGASTAVFGTVGVLAALNLVRYRHNLWKRWPLPVAAALGLLALLGTEGERTDLGAHLFGFAVGLLIGRGIAPLLQQHGRPGRRLNFFLALFSIGVVGIAWWAALGSV